MKEMDLQLGKTVEIKTEENISEQYNLLVGKNANLIDNMNMENNLQADQKPLYKADTDLPEELVQNLNQLAGDRSKASEYFKPVVVSANKVLRGCSSKEEMETELTNLVSHMCYYLDNRKSSFFMPTRNARRATCERVMAGIGRYMYDSEGAELADKMQIKVHDIQKSRKWEASYVDQFKRDYGQCMNDYFISGRLAQKDIFDIPRDKMTKDVSDIIMGLDGAQAILTNKMPPTPPEDATPEVKAAFFDEIRMVGLGLSKMYDKVITASKAYLATKNRDPMVTTMARGIMAVCSYDRKVFVSSITQYVDGHKGKGVVTWGEALADKGSTSVQLADKDVVKMGMGTSVIYKYKNKGENKYFKEEEKSSENIEQTWNAIKAKIKDMPAYKPEYDKLIQRLDKAIEKQFDYVKEVNFKNMSRNATLSINYSNLVGKFLFNKIPGNYVEKAKAMASNNENGKYLALNPLVQFLSEIDVDDEASAFISNIVSDFLKHFNSDIISSNVAMIEDGSVISQRNVATSRMGDLLGISHLVMRSETAEVMNGEKKLIGNVMEEAKGKAAFDVLFEDKQKNKYDLKVVKDIATMHVFDLICGQIDRNRDNYYMEAKDGVITGIQMIDNDMSFGFIKDIKKGSKMTQQLAPINDELIDALPNAVIATVKRLGRLSKGDFGFFFGDLLSDKEIDYMIDRVKMVVDAIEEREKYHSDRLVNGNEEEKKIAALMKDDDFKAINYQYRLCTEVNKQWEEYYDKNKYKPKREKKGVFIYNWMREKGYLLYGNIQFDIIKNVYEGYVKG